MILDRKALNNGAFLNAFREIPGPGLWSESRIEQSMKTMLKAHVAGEPVWIFAYGSLICNPLFQYAEKQLAVLEGWHRSFCIRLILGRGTVDQPGRMLALEPGGRTAGLVYRFREETLENELRMVWMREMVAGFYQPVWADVIVADGRTVRAIIFAADPAHMFYEKDSSPDNIISSVSAAHGNLGRNRDYVLRLNDTLCHHGLVDEYIHELAARLRAEAASEQDTDSSGAS
ncbi:gamma-glutamylcyclotransferase [Klebsiella pneumoniae]|nr:gamma-glutamylcyclotransferase [Klebsiella pneumoniae]